MDHPPQNNPLASGRPYKPLSGVLQCQIKVVSMVASLVIIVLYFINVVITTAV